MTKRPLSHTKRGKLLAATGGLAGGPIGVILFPLILMRLNAIKKEGNRFITLFLIGIIAAPLCWMATIIIVIFTYIGLQVKYCQDNPTPVNCDIGFPTPN